MIFFFQDLNMEFEIFLALIRLNYKEICYTNFSAVEFLKLIHNYCGPIY